MFDEFVCLGGEVFCCCFGGEGGYIIEERSSLLEGGGEDLALTELDEDNVTGCFVGCAVFFVGVEGVVVVVVDSPDSSPCNASRLKIDEDETSFEASSTYWDN